MRKSFGLTITLSVVLALFFVGVSEGRELLGTAKAIVTKNMGSQPYDFCKDIDSLFDVTLEGGPIPGDYPGWCLQPSVHTPNDTFDDVELFSDPDEVDITPLINCLLSKVEDYLGETISLPGIVGNTKICVWHIQGVIWSESGVLATADPKFFTEDQKDEVAALIEVLEDDCAGFVPDVVGVIVALYEEFEKQDLLIPVSMGECDGKLTELTLMYTGNETAYITVVQNKGNGDPVFEGSVEPDKRFSFSGTWKKDVLGTQIKITAEIPGNPPEVLTACMHTSCSQEIGPGTVCGPFKVVAGISRNGGFLPPVSDTSDACDDCGKDKTNNGNKPAPGKSSTISTLWGDLKTK